MGAGPFLPGWSAQSIIFAFWEGGLSTEEENGNPLGGVKLRLVGAQNPMLAFLHKLGGCAG